MSFVVIATEGSRGAVFETSDAGRFAITAVDSLAAAVEVAARLGPSARVFEVRPSWSRPSLEWTAANPGLWDGVAAAGPPGQNLPANR
jgi:hypothetical protein